MTDASLALIYLTRHRLRCEVTLAQETRFFCSTRERLAQAAGHEGMWSVAG